MYMYTTSNTIDNKLCFLETCCVVDNLPIVENNMKLPITIHHILLFQISADNTYS